jgi:hypothetical protein
VTYSPPRGWIEPTPTKLGDQERNLAIFHTRKTCSRINDVGSLQPVERPYSAARCSACAGTSH